MVFKVGFKKPKAMSFLIAFIITTVGSIFETHGKKDCLA
jgi:hypothetical protein